MATVDVLRRLRGGHGGQSWVETVILLQVLMLLLLGLTYLKALVDTRQRALEAVRYMAWESVWHARENRPGRAAKSNRELARELRAIGLGRGLAAIDAENAQTLSEYRASFLGGREEAGVAIFAPAALPELFGGSSAESLARVDTSFASEIPPEVSDFAQDVADVGGAALSSAHDLFARQTLWEDEARASVRRFRVVYRLGRTGLFRILPPIEVGAETALLGHPYNMRRSNDLQEYRDLVGGAVCDPTGLLVAEENLGHVFDLWLYPSGELTPETAAFGADARQVMQFFGEATSAAARAPKCAVVTPFALIDAIEDAIGPLGTALGFKMPDGTLKEFPEVSEPGVSSGRQGFGSDIGEVEGAPLAPPRRRAF